MLISLQEAEGLPPRVDQRKDQQVARVGTTGEVKGQPTRSSCMAACTTAAFDKLCDVDQ